MEKISTPQNKEILYTVKEVAELLKTNTTYVYKLINAGLLPYMKLGTYKIKKDELNKFLDFCTGKDITDPFNISIIKRDADIENDP